MAELTLERIAELRALASAPVSDYNVMAYRCAVSDSIHAMLDAAERGLTNDRKAAAFDRLAALGAFEVMIYDDMAFLYAGHDDSHAPTLLEAVEALPEVIHESK